MIRRGGGGLQENQQQQQQLGGFPPAETVVEAGTVGDDESAHSKERAQGAQQASSGVGRPPRRRALRAAVGSVAAVWFLWFVVLGKHSFELSMETGHMNFRQRVGDAFWVAASLRQQWLSVEGGPSLESFPANASLARASCVAQRPHLVMHLKVPKAASTTVFDVLYALAAANGFAVDSRPLYLDAAPRPRRVARQYVRYLASLRRRTAHTAHGPYLDAVALGSGGRRPAYVALVREPAERLRSHYNYIHWGPRSRWARFWKGQDASAEPFEACVARARATEMPTLRRRRQSDDRGHCLYWANVQLAYFCGLPCRHHTAITYDNGGPAALEAALANFRRDFVAVGLVEDILPSFRLFEKVLPSFFAGAPAKADGLIARSTSGRVPEKKANKATPLAARTHQAPSSPSLRKLLLGPVAASRTARRSMTASAVTGNNNGSHAGPGTGDDLAHFLATTILPFEYRLYEFARESFRRQLLACGIR